MGRPCQPRPAKMIVGLLWGREEDLGTALADLARAFGPLESRSPVRPFTETDFYAPELGEALSRGWVSLEGTVDPGRLAGLKLAANRLEEAYARPDGRRRVNLDPGLLSLNSLVLASTKPSPHRIYLGQGIHAEVELIFRRGRFEPLPWTYPDYTGEGFWAWLKEVREAYKEGLKREPRAARPEV